MSEGRTPLPHALCAKIGSKKLYMLPEGHDVCQEDLQTAGYDNSWCADTMTDTALDGGWVTFDRCAPGRACYQARGGAPAPREEGK
jgi:hypothetical protein